MPFHYAPLSRPSAAWISRYAEGLLASTPSMLPLDAVRQAMEASETVIGEEAGEPSPDDDPAPQGSARSTRAA